MIVVAGETLIDLVADQDGRYRPIPGGSPMNVAVGTARLGNPTQMLARLGTGTFGKALRAHMVRNDVGLDYAARASEPTTLAVVSLDSSGVPEYEFYVQGTADWAWTDAELPNPLPEGTSAFITGSLALAIEPGATALAQLINREHQRGEVTLMLDPNIRPALSGTPESARARLEPLVSLAQVVKVSDEDLRWLCPGEDDHDVAKRWANSGPSLVVVTRGSRGSYGLTSAGVETEVAARPTKLVDTVGAGDSFSAGLLDGLGRSGLLGAGTASAISALTSGQLARLLDRSGTASAITCGRAGADPPTLEELETAFAAG